MTRPLRNPASDDREAEFDLPMLVVDRDADGDDRPGRRPRRIRRRWLLLLPLLWLAVATGGIVGLYIQPLPLRIVMGTLGLEPGGGTENPIAVPAARMGAPQTGATPDAPETVVALGVLLPESDVITIAPPFGAGDARIASVEVREGDSVATGAVLAVLDSAPRLEAAVATARADLAVQEALLAERRAAITASRDEARAALSRAEAAAENARRDLKRTQTLVGKGVASEALADERRAAATQAEQDVQRALATLSRYESAGIDAQPDVIVAARNVDAARARLERAESEAEAGRIRAPIAGTVLKIHARPGERPGEEGILNLGDIGRMMAKVEIYQSDIGLIDLGQPVEIAAGALPGTLTGQVASIGLQVDRQGLVEDDPAANTDARVVEVWVALDEASSAIAARFTNLQVTARISTGAHP